MGLFKSNDDSLTEQKVWLNPGNSGIAMATSSEKHTTPPPPSEAAPTAAAPPPPTSQPDYSGLQVVESGLEVAGSDQSEALSAGSAPSSHPFHSQHTQSPFDQASPPLRYAEQKGYDWHGAPPPQVVPIEQSGMGGGYPGGNRLYSASTGTSQQHQYLGGHNPYDPAAGKPERKPTICGLKKKLFWGIVAVIIFVIILAVAVGVGVGVAVRNSSSRYAHDLLDLPWPRLSAHHPGRKPVPWYSFLSKCHGHVSSRAVCSVAARLVLNHYPTLLTRHAFPEGPSRFGTNFGTFSGNAILFVSQNSTNTRSSSVVLVAVPTPAPPPQPRQHPHQPQRPPP